jgi:hypothetical protein
MMIPDSFEEALNVLIVLGVTQMESSPDRKLHRALEICTRYLELDPKHPPAISSEQLEVLRDWMISKRWQEEEAATLQSPTGAHQ